MENLETLSDVIAAGNAAEDSGTPIVAHWRRVRGSLYMLEYASGGPDQVRLDDFEETFPEDFDALDPEIRHMLTGADDYAWFRRQSRRVLAVMGKIDDPWEAVWMFAWSGCANGAQKRLQELRFPAVRDGLAPSQITTEWVWRLDAELGPGKRGNFRRGLVAFNRLFDNARVINLGLLPPDRLEYPPDYDRQGRIKHPLPPTLARYAETAAKYDRIALRALWQAICVSGDFNLPEDPSADDLLSPSTWAKLVELPHETTGISKSAWRRYLRHVRRLMRQ